MPDTEAQITEETKLDADDAINASIEAAQVEHGGESDADTEDTVVSATDTADSPDKSDASVTESVTDVGTVDAPEGEQLGAAKVADGASDGDTDTATGLEAPTHWPSDKRELFQKHPKDVQEFMLNEHKEMQADYTHKLSQIAPLRNTVQKWTPYLTSTGQTAEYAFDLLMSAEQRLRTGTAQEKVAVVDALITDFNIPYENYAQSRREEQVEPDEQQLMEQHVSRAIQPYQQQVQQMQMHQQQQQQQAAQAQYSSLQQQVNTFAVEKTEAGQLAHPYFNDPGIEQTMATLAEQEQKSGRTPNLQDLYDSAVWANTSTRAKLQQASQSSYEAQRKERVAKSRNAGASVVTGSGAAPTDKQPEGIDNIINSAFEEHASA